MKKLTLIALLIALTGIVAQAINIDQNFTIPLKSGAVTNAAVQMADGGKIVDWINVNNTAVFSNRVSVVMYDGGVVGPTLYSGDLAAGGTETVYPSRTVTGGNYTGIIQHAVCNMRVLVTAINPVGTNTTTGTVRLFIQSR